MKRQDTKTQDFKFVEIPEKNLDMRVIVCGVEKIRKAHPLSGLNCFG